MNVNATSEANSFLDQLQARPEEAPNDELGKDEFLKLLVTQMENQNPLEPQDNGEFIAQLAQFSSLEGIDNLNDTMGSFVSNFQSGMALEATALVGRRVQVDTDVALLQQGELFTGVIQLPTSGSDVRLSIHNESGELVRNVNLGNQPAEDYDFLWDGLDNNGEALPTGLYTVKAEAKIDGTVTQLNTLLGANVNSVTLGSRGGGGTTLNLAGIGKVPLEDVQTIQ